MNYPKVKVRQNVFNIGDKVAALVVSNVTGKRMQVPQVILSDTKQIRVPAVRNGEPVMGPNGQQRIYINTVATVLAKHPETGLLYLRPEEVLNFHIPRFSNVEGLDVLNGKALTLEELANLYAEALTDRLEERDTAEVAI